MLFVAVSVSVQHWPFPPLGGLLYHSWVLLNTAECVTCTNQSSLGGEFSAAWTGAKNVTESHPGELCSRGPRPGWWAQGNYTEGMFRWLSLPFLLYPCFQWKALFAHGGRGSGSSWFPRVGWAPSARACRWQNAVTARFLLISSYKPTSEVGLGFLTSSASGSTTPLKEGKTPCIYFRRCVKCFFSHTNALVWDVSCVQNSCLLLAWIFRSVLESALIRS